MAIDAVFTPASGQQASYRPVNRTAERGFYSGMATLLCICVFIGFSPTYFQAGMMRAPFPSPILHVHGAVFTLWMLVFIVRVALISARRVKWHRSFGTVAFCLPPIMIVVGVIAAIDALMMIGPLDPSASAAFPLIGIVAFAIVIYASWRARRRPDAHKRLHPQLQLQLGQQSLEPACMPASFHCHTHLLARQSTVEVLRLFAVG
jgi:hypothetical protein